MKTKIILAPLLIVLGLSACASHYTKADGQRCSLSPMTPLYMLSMGKKGLLCQDGPTIGSAEWKLSSAENEARHAANQASDWANSALSDLSLFRQAIDSGWIEQAQENIASANKNAKGARQFANKAVKAAKTANEIDSNSASAKNASMYAKNADALASKAEGATKIIMQYSQLNILSETN
ncbi:TPA: hypothetical protein QHU45_003063 [Escherichia coli]|nr:hypothetical protein [Escherichia coli]HDS5816618.1 hypothetical protein [Escherichia coli]HDS5914431.1 hypothetical protein [Escherichia coli]HDS6081349.1 hypothetical protein [Escherichia coli]HDS7279513.1 hypothetical protein [Escherichia coli]